VLQFGQPRVQLREDVPFRHSAKRFPRVEHLVKLHEHFIDRINQP
jgi:hypothetical protein